MTDEEMRNVIALLDSAKKICAAAQFRSSIASADNDEPADLMPASTHPNIFQIYWVGCRGLADLSRSIAASENAATKSGYIVSKIGLTQEGLERRLSTLGQDKYGSIQRHAGKFIDSPGFERWVAQAIHVSRKPRDAAISVAARTINVVLPQGMTRRQLDLGLRRGLAPFSLHERHVERFTKYSGLDRLSRATELVIGPNPRDADFLLEIVEKILADHRAKIAVSCGTVSTSSKASMFKVRPTKLETRRRS